MFIDAKMLMKLRKSLSKKRFDQCLKVMETAEELAIIHECDVKKAKIAGLFHDCAREVPQDHLLKMAEDFGILLDEIQKREKVLIHGPLGAAVARKVYGISDNDILRAIRLHTTGDKDMEMLDKVIFVSDYIEPTRNFPGIGKIRDMAIENLDEALILALDSTIKYVIAKGKLLHPKTLNARNYILLKKESDEEP